MGEKPLQKGEKVLWAMMNSSFKTDTFFCQFAHKRLLMLIFSHNKLEITSINSAAGAFFVHLLLQF